MRFFLSLSLESHANSHEAADAYFQTELSVLARSNLEAHNETTSLIKKKTIKQNRMVL